MKFGSSFTDIFKNKCTYFYQDIFRFDISIAHCPGGYFFSWTQCSLPVTSRRTTSRQDALCLFRLQSEVQSYYMCCLYVKPRTLWHSSCIKYTRQATYEWTTVYELLFFCVL